MTSPPSDRLRHSPLAGVEQDISEVQDGDLGEPQLDVRRFRCDYGQAGPVLSGEEPRRLRVPGQARAEARNPR